MKNVKIKLMSLFCMLTLFNLTTSIYAMKNKNYNNINYNNKTKIEEINNKLIEILNNSDNIIDKKKFENIKLDFSEYLAKNKNISEKLTYEILANIDKIDSKIKNNENKINKEIKDQNKKKLIDFDNKFEEMNKNIYLNDEKYSIIKKKFYETKKQLDLYLNNLKKDKYKNIIEKIKTNILIINKKIENQEKYNIAPFVIENLKYYEKKFSEFLPYFGKDIIEKNNTTQFGTKFAQKKEIISQMKEFFSYKSMFNGYYEPIKNNLGEKPNALCKKICGNINLISEYIEKIEKMNYYQNIEKLNQQKNNKNNKKYKNYNEKDEEMNYSDILENISDEKINKINKNKKSANTNNKEDYNDLKDTLKKIIDKIYEKPKDKEDSTKKNIPDFESMFKYIFKNLDNPNFKRYKSSFERTKANFEQNLKNNVQNMENDKLNNIFDLIKKIDEKIKEKEKLNENNIINNIEEEIEEEEIEEEEFYENNKVLYKELIKKLSEFDKIFKNYIENTINNSKKFNETKSNKIIYEYNKNIYENNKKEFIDYININKDKFKNDPAIKYFKTQIFDNIKKADQINMDIYEKISKIQDIKIPDNYFKNTP